MTNTRWLSPAQMLLARDLLKGRVQVYSTVVLRTAMTLCERGIVRIEPPEKEGARATVVVIPEAYEEFLQDQRAQSRARYRQRTTLIQRIKEAK